MVAEIIIVIYFSEHRL